MELHRSEEAAATPETEGANLSEQFVSNNKTNGQRLSLSAAASFLCRGSPGGSLLRQSTGKDKADSPNAKSGRAPRRPALMSGALHHPADSIRLQ